MNLSSGRLVDPALFHDESNIFHRADVFQGIAVHRDDVCAFAGHEFTPVVHAEQVSGVDRGHFQGVFFGDAVIDQRREFLRVFTVRENAGIRAQRHVHPALIGFQQALNGQGFEVIVLFHRCFRCFGGQIHIVKVDIRHQVGAALFHQADGFVGQDRTVLDGILHAVAAVTVTIGNALRNYFDKPIVNGFGDFVGENTKKLGGIFRTIQTGRVQQYMILALVSIAGFSALFYYLLVFGR